MKTENNSKYGGDLDFKLFYLEKVKENFSKTTYHNIEVLIRNAKLYEDLFEKDLYNFTLSEVTDMLTSLRAKTKNSLRQKMSVYAQYVDTAIAKGVSLNSSNVVRSILSSELDDIVDLEATNQRYITREDLFNTIVYLNNDQDRVVFALLFDGVMGNNYENLVNLKFDDIDRKTLRAKLFDGTEVTLSKETYNLVQLANQEDTYETEYTTYRLVPNEYVIKAPKRLRGTEKEALRPNSIRIKIDKFKKDLRISGLTGRSIYLSGVADKFIKEFGNNVSVVKLTEVQDWLSSNNVNTNAQEFRGIVELVFNKLTSVL